MSKKAYKAISIIACVIAVIGLLSYMGGIHTVNWGAFVFPAVISVGAFLMYKKKQNDPD